jgi:glutamyl-tRNA reductase
MALLTLAVTYRETPLTELERAAIRSEELADALPCLLRAPDVREALVLSTCNRVEIYTWAGEPDAAVDQIELFLEDLRDLPMGWTRAHATVLRDEAVIRHLFAVAAGLDSMVSGENEIQGQVRRAYRTAAAAGAVGPHLHGLFRWALEAGKRTRRTSGLSRATDSFPRAAVKAIGSMLGGVAGRDVLVVGNGRMAIASLRALVQDGARVRIAARRPQAAEELAAQFGGTAIALQELGSALTHSDAAIFATSAREPLIAADAFRHLIPLREGRPITVIDLGLPRNVDPDTAELDGGKDGFDLFDIAKLDRHGFTAPGGRASQIEEARRIVLVEAERCAAWFRSRPADEVVGAIRAQADRVAAGEVERAARISGLDERQRAAVERAIRRTVAKVVHTPTIRAKEACARGDEGLLHAARWLFGVDGWDEDERVDLEGLSR